MAGTLLRERDGGHARVGFAELFYDLVFVFAITQLSHALLAHLTPLGLVETAMLFCGVWWSWVYTTWATNFLDPEKLRVRLLLFALMAAGLVLSMSIPQAFGGRGMSFAIAFAGMQVGRGVFMVLALRRTEPANHRNFIRITIWSALSGAVWIWGGLADPADRPLIWAAALAFEFAGPPLGFRLPGLGASKTSDWNVEGGHMAERCGLFIIIALGESILITGATFADGLWEGARIAGFASAFIGTLAMWWLYFNIGAERGTHHFEHADDPGRIARFAYTYLHMPIVAGIVLTAASDELVLEHPHGHATALQLVCIVGGPALYLFGNLLFKRVTAPNLPLSHLVGLGLFGGLLLISGRLDPLGISLASTGILLLAAVWETLSLGQGEASGPKKKELAEDGG